MTDDHGRVLPSRRGEADPDDRSERRESERAEPIAIVGMGCRVPGADDVGELWRLLCDGVDATTPLPTDRWDPALHGGDPQTPGTIYSQRGGFLRDVDTFDAAFFGISPAEAERLDPQQRLLLEVAWHALENAQIPIERLRSTRCGVYVGLSATDYKNLQVADPAQIDGYTSIGNVFALASGRLSHAFDLTGPSLAVDAACASSLVTVHLAAQALRSGECEVALAGGVNLMLGEELTLSLSRTGALSAEGRCKTFDASADGYVRGEGCGIVVLKRLNDAALAGDRIVAVVRGSAVNHDGADSGLTVPNGRAHEDVLRRALADAGVLPREIGYLEAHGTGTPVGDPTELRAVGAVFSADRPEQQPLLVGSVKTNVGHLEAAAGVVGLIKAALTIRHALVPPHLHLRERHPAIPWDELPVEVATGRRGWPGQPPSEARLAGVSSFGIGGTNAHVVLAGAPDHDVPGQGTSAAPGATLPTLSTLPTLLPLSARDPAALRDLATQYAALVRTREDIPLPELAAAAAVGRGQLTHRAAIVTEDREQLLTRLDGVATGGSVPSVATGRVSSQRPLVAFAFSGQGSQYAGMGMRLADTEPVYAEALAYCEELVGDQLGGSLRTVLTGTGPDPEAIHRTDWTQVGLFAMQYALTALWRSWGVQPAAVLGHSAGELAAAAAAGAVSVEDALSLVVARGRLMQALPPGGRMVAVFAEADRVTAVLQAHPNVSVAAVNSADEVVLSGPSAAVTAAVEELSALPPSDVQTRDLAVPLAGHSALMDPILDKLEYAAANVAHRPPDASIVSTVTGGVLPAGALDARYWRRNLRQPVLFHQAASALLADHDVVIDIGPGPVLGRLADRAGLLGTNQRWVSSLQRDQDPRSTLLGALGEVYAAGVDVDWEQVTRRPSTSIPLPTYPFQRRRYWRDTTRSPAARSVGHPLLGRRLDSPALSGVVFEAEWSTEALPEHFADHVLYDAPVGSGGYQLAAVLAAVAEAVGESKTAPTGTPDAGGAAVEKGAILLEQVAFVEPLVFGAGRDPVTVQVILGEQDVAGGRALQLVSRRPGGPWVTHLTSTIRAGAAAASDPTVGAARAANVAPADVAPADVAPTDAVPTDAAITSEAEAARMHRALEAGGFAFGPTYHWLAELGAAPGLATASLSRPDGVRPVQGPPPGLVEGWLRVLLATAPGALDASSDDDPGSWLPVEIDRLCWYAARGATDPDRARAHARLLSERSGSEQVVGDLVLTNIDGDPIATATGVRGRRVPRRALSWAADVPPCHDMVWREIAAPAVDEEAAYGDWAIVSGEDVEPIAATLAELVTKTGGRCHRLPTEVKTAAEVAAHVTALAETGRLRGIVQLSALRDNCDGPTVLEPSNGVAARTHGDATPLKAQRDGVVLAARLVRSAVDAQVPRLLLATRGAVSTGSEEHLDPTHATLHGLARVAEIEHPDLACTVVDLDTGTDPVAHTDPAHAARALYAALLASTEPRLAVRSDRWFAPRLTRAQPTKQAAQRPEVPVRADAAYIVTGGAGALGGHAVTWLADHGAARVYLLGRKPPQNPHQASGNTEVRWVRCDVTDATEVRRTLATLTDEGPPVRGIVHAAGVLADGTLEQIDDARLLQPLQPKLAGAWNLHRASRELGLELDLVAYFSSVAGILGNAGQAGYAAGNAFLDAFAAYQRRLGIPAVSLAWGPWEGPGMVTLLAERERERVLDLGLTPLVPTDMAVLDHVWDGPPLRVIARADWTRVADQVSGDRSGLLGGLLEDDAQHASTTPPGTRDRHPRPAGAGEYVTPHTATERALAEVWEELFQIAPIGVEDNFFAFGGDSILALRIVAAARAAGLRLTGADVLAHPTVAELSRTAVPLNESAPSDPAHTSDGAEPPEPAASITDGTGVAPHELRPDDFPNSGLDREDLALLAEQLSGEHAVPDPSQEGTSRW